MGGILALPYGLVAYAAFLIAILYAIGFPGNLLVPKGIDSGTDGPVLTAVVVNVLLMGLFAIQHSVMARPGFKRWWTRLVPEAVERSTYVLLASLLLLLLYWQWQPMSGIVWQVTDQLGATLLWALYAAGWAIVLLSTFMIGHSEMFGLAQVLRRLQNRVAEAVQFREPGFYKWVRHPIMVGFIIAFWATPVMTTGHLLFAAVTTAYIRIAIPFEERDLASMLGPDYAEYRARVPALIPFLKRGGSAKKRGRDTGAS